MRAITYINTFRAHAGKNEVIAFVIAFAAAYLLFPVYFDFPVYPVSYPSAAWSSLDPSWKLLLNKTNMDHLVWGKDLTLTYGPLGYLSTRVGWGISRYTLLLFDLFVFFNFLCVFYNICHKPGKIIFAGLLVAIVLICLPQYFGSGNALVLLAFLIFWIRQSLGSVRLFYYGMQTALLTLLFFMKFNTGLATFVFFLAGLFYNFITLKEKRIALGVFAVAPFICVLLFSYLLEVDLAAYIRGGLQMVTGYNGIMYLEQDFAKELAFALLVLGLTVVLYVLRFYAEKERSKNFLLACVLFASLYILYKQAFVRNDAQHVFDFYKYGLLFVLCGYDVFAGKSAKPLPAVVLTSLVVSLLVIVVSDRHYFHFQKEINKADYGRNFVHFTGTSGLHLYPNPNQLPERIKNKIGKKFVDVYPWNIHLLIENKLSYRPRPAPQSYTAYTPYLENLNAAYYTSPAAPGYVLYEYAAIDERYPLFDEPKLNLILLRNYRCADTFYFNKRLVLVLEKMNAAKLHFEKQREFTMQLNDKLVPDLNSYYEIEIGHSLAGLCRSFLSYEPKLQLLITTKEGKQKVYKTSVGLLRTGIFSTSFFETTESFYRFMNKESPGKENEIESYSFKPADPSLFKQGVKITEYKIAQ